MNSYKEYYFPAREYEFSLPHLYISLKKVGRTYFLNLGVKRLISTLGTGCAQLTTGPRCGETDVSSVSQLCRPTVDRRSTSPPTVGEQTSVDRSTDCRPTVGRSVGRLSVGRLTWTSSSRISASVFKRVPRFGFVRPKSPCTNSLT